MGGRTFWTRTFRPRTFQPRTFRTGLFSRVDVSDRFFYKKAFLLKPTQDCTAQVIDLKCLRCEIENLNFNRGKSRESSSFETYSGLHCSGD